MLRLNSHGPLSASVQVPEGRSLSRQCFIEDFSFLGVGLLCFFAFLLDVWLHLNHFFLFLIISLFPFTFSPCVQEALPQQKFLLSLLFFYDGWVIKGINAQRITPPAPHGPCDSTPGVRGCCRSLRVTRALPPRVNLKVKEGAQPRHTHTPQRKEGPTRGGGGGLNLDAEQPKAGEGEMVIYGCWNAAESIINLSSLSLPTVDLMITGGTSISGVINVYIFFPPSFHERLQCQVQLILTGSHVLMSFSLSLFYFPVLFIA